MFWYYILYDSLGLWTRGQFPRQKIIYGLKTYVILSLHYRDKENIK